MRAVEDSGIEWISELPQDWQVRRLGVIAELIREQKKGFPVYELDDFESWTGRLVDSSRLFDKAESMGGAFLAGDVLFGKLRPYLAKSWFAENPGITLGDIFVLRSTYLDGRYFSYFFQSPVFIDLIDSNSYGSKMPRINWDQLRNIYVSVPPRGEQQDIARYLDKETSQIDLLISKKEQLIQKLLERRQALITQAVTKGLDPNVPIKDSGIEWIGDIPRHWSASQLGRVLQSSVVDGPHETPTFRDEGHPFLSVDSIVDGELEELQTRLISEADFKTFRRKARPERDDILMGKAASIGKIARVKTDWEFAIWSPLALLKISKAEGNPGFIEFSLKSSCVQAQIEVLSSSNTQKNLSMGKIPSLKIALPPLAEQAAIAEYLANETEQISALIAKIRKALWLLKERRQALITQVVTGKLDVRGFADGNS